MIHNPISLRNTTDTNLVYPQLGPAAGATKINTFPYLRGTSRPVPAMLPPDGRTPTQAAGRLVDHSWQPGFAFKCRGTMRVKVYATAPGTSGGHLGGTTGSAERSYLRICKGNHGCDGAESIVDADGGAALYPALEFNCGLGYTTTPSSTSYYMYNWMGRAHVPTSTTARMSVAAYTNGCTAPGSNVNGQVCAGQGLAFPASEWQVFKTREGAFAGNLFVAQFGDTSVSAPSARGPFNQTIQTSLNFFMTSTNQVNSPALSYVIANCEPRIVDERSGPRNVGPFTYRTWKTWCRKDDPSCTLGCYNRDLVCYAENSLNEPFTGIGTGCSTSMPTLYSCSDAAFATSGNVYNAYRACSKEGSDAECFTRWRGNCGAGNTPFSGEGSDAPAIVVYLPTDVSSAL